jgi:hypothetical protein
VRLAKSPPNQITGNLAAWGHKTDREDVSRVRFLRTLFSTTGLLIVVYILIGVFFNTAPPHLPVTTATTGSLHSWAQYIISVLVWPLSLWHPTFTLGKWTP